MSADTELSVLLRNWTPKVEPESGFNRSVWSRIESVESGRAISSSLFSWLQRLAMPRIAATCIAMALFGGILIGRMQARSSEEECYLLSLNPLASIAHTR